MSETADPIAAAREAGRSALTEAEAKSLLAEAGVETPASGTAANPDEAVDVAEELGYPVVAKVASPEVQHKSEWGGGVGVALGLDSPDAVREAAAHIFDAAEEAGIDASVFVEAAQDVDRGTEVIVGGLRDPSFGPVVMTGLGGIFAEVYADTSHRIAPIDRPQARAALRELTAATILEGYRGQPPADLDALADVVVAVGDLVTEHEAIAEVDVNPVLATPEGAIALDAAVSLEADP